MFPAADAGFYLALDAGREDCIDALGDGAFYLPPKVIDIIADIVAFSTNQELKIRASQALLFMATYPAFAVPVPPQKSGCDTAFAKLLLEREIFDDTPANRVRAQLLGECACIGISTLYTLDSGLLKLSQDTLDGLVSAQDLNRFKIATVD